MGQTRGFSYSGEVLCSMIKSVEATKQFIIRIQDYLERQHGISYITHVGPCIDKQQNPSYWEHVGYINTAVILVVVLHLYIQITMNIQTYTAYSTIFILTPIPSQFDMLHVTKDSKISSI